MYSLLGNQWDTGPAARRQDRLSGATANGRGSADPVGGNLLSGKPSNKETGLSDMNFQAKLEAPVQLDSGCSSPGQPPLQDLSSPTPPVPTGVLSLIQLTLQPASQILVRLWITRNTVKMEVLIRGS